MKLYNSLPISSRSILGNIAVIEGGTELLWEVPENNSLLISLLERQLQIMVASVANKWYNVGSGIDGNRIMVDIPDDRGTIILPKTELLVFEKIEVLSHYTIGRLSITGCNSTVLFENGDTKDFCNALIKEFHAMLTDIHRRKMEL